MAAEIEIGIKVWLYPLDLVREVIKGRDISTKPGEYHLPSPLDQLATEIGKIRYVKEADFGHLNYVEFDPETGDFEEARRRVEKVRERVAAKIRIWAKRLPMKSEATA